MAETAEKQKESGVKTGFVVLEFIKSHGSRKKGDKETYHRSTANALVEKLKVAKVIEELKKFVPAKEEK